MAQPIGILTLHGIGEQSQDFDRDLRRKLLGRLSPELRGGVRFKSIYYQDILQGPQDEVWERMQPSKLRWLRVRRFFMHAFSDATTYQYRAANKTSVYSRVNNRIRDRVDELAGELGSEQAPLVIVAHSLGGQVISNYIWDAQRGKGIWKGRPPTEFQGLGTTAYMFTAGCNIPFFVSGYDNVQAIDPPNERFRWLNYYDRDDLLGWPLKPLSSGFANSYDEIVERDIQINAGSWLSSWSPLSHVGYWTDKDFLKPLAEAITDLHSV